MNPAAPGVRTNVSAVVTDDTGASIASFPSTSVGLFTVTGLVPGVEYTLRASCEDALGAACPDLIHRWRSVPCPLPAADAPLGLQAVIVGQGVRYVTWLSAAPAFQYSLDGGPWLPVPEVHPGVAPLGLLVRLALVAAPCMTLLAGGNVRFTPIAEGPAERALSAVGASSR